MQEILKHEDELESRHASNVTGKHQNMRITDLVKVVSTVRETGVSMFHDALNLDHSQSIAHQIIGFRHYLIASCPLCITWMAIDASHILLDLRFDCIK